MNNKTVMTIEDYRNEIANEFAANMVKLLELNRDKCGFDETILIASAFVQKLVGIQILSGLKQAQYANRGNSVPVTYEATRKALAKLKYLLQEAVASGFEGALKQFAKDVPEAQDINYVCIIKPSDPGSKTIQ